MALNETMSHMSKDHESWVIDDGNHVMVPNPDEMISTVAPMIRINAWVLEPQGANEKLDFQHGGVQHHVQPPQSFVLIDTISNPMGVSTFSGVSRKALNFIARSKASTSLMGAAKIMCQTSLFYAKTLAISGIQLATMFHLVATLRENGGTLNVMVRL
jgi:hypothetical protein